MSTKLRITELIHTFETLGLTNGLHTIGFHTCERPPFMTGLGSQIQTTSGSSIGCQRYVRSSNI